MSKILCRECLVNMICKDTCQHFMLSIVDNFLFCMKTTVGRNRIFKYLRYNYKYENKGVFTYGGDDMCILIGGLREVTIAKKIDGRFEGHSLDTPAYANDDGVVAWMKNGVYHRDDGPAIYNVYTNFKKWVVNGVVHRDDGPAIIEACGTQRWFKNGVPHRDDGPAIITEKGVSYMVSNGMIAIYKEQNVKKVKLK